MHRSPSVRVSRRTPRLDGMVGTAAPLRRDCARTQGNKQHARKPQAHRRRPSDRVHTTMRNKSPNAKNGSYRCPTGLNVQTSFAAQELGRSATSWRTVTGTARPARRRLTHRCTRQAVGRCLQRPLRKDH